MANDNSRKIADGEVGQRDWEAKEVNERNS